MERTEDRIETLEIIDEIRTPGNERLICAVRRVRGESGEKYSIGVLRNVRLKGSLSFVDREINTEPIRWLSTTSTIPSMMVGWRGVLEQFMRNENGFQKDQHEQAAALTCYAVMQLSGFSWDHDFPMLRGFLNDALYKKDPVTYEGIPHTDDPLPVGAF